MLTDALSKGGLNVPHIEGPLADELKSKLFPGSSVANPIDFLATGTPEQLGTVIDYCENKFDHIDAIAVIYGTPGLTQLYEAYDVLDQKIRECKKPIFPVLPSLHTAGPEVEEFLKKGHVNFSDEVTLATALSQVMNTPPPAPPEVQLYGIDIPRLNKIIFRETSRLKFEGLRSGYLAPDTVREIHACAGIPLVPEMVSTSKDELTAFAQKVGFPVVAKVVGPVHKSDVGGVALNIRTPEHLALEFDRMMQIQDATGVMVQKMLKGTELFIGAKYEERFGHVVLCGLGGIFVEVLKDVSSGLAPLSYGEAWSMIRSLRGYKILKGTRGQRGINEQKFADIIVRLSTLLRFATEIKEMDLNPLLADENDIVDVDARILIERED
jgi:acetyltransferase